MQNISKSYCISVLANQKCALHVLVAFEVLNIKISYFKNKLHVCGGLFLYLCSCEQKCHGQIMSINYCGLSIPFQ